MRVWGNKLLKPLAITLLILLICALLGTGYLYATCSVTVADTALTVSDAAAQEKAFLSLQEQMRNGALSGLVYTDSLDGAADEYQFLQFEVTLRNTCFLPADMVELQVLPQSGDILQLADFSDHMLSRRSSGTFTATVLSRKSEILPHEIQVTFTMWGIPFRLKAHYSR